MLRLHKLFLFLNFAIAWIQLTPRLASGQDANYEEFLDANGTVAFPWTARVEYQFWWTKGNPTPALVTFSPDGTDRADAGVLGSPGVQVLAGNEQFDRTVRSGGRVTLSHQFDSAPALAVELGALFVGDGQPSQDFYQFSPGTPIISRPFYNAAESREDAELVAYPDLLEGAVTVHSTSEIVSPELCLSCQLPDDSLGRVRLLGGYRYFRLRDSLSVRENLVSIDQGGLIPLGTTTTVEDRFVTCNEFHGGQVGASLDMERNLVTLSFLAKVALGNLHQAVDVRGKTMVAIPGLPSTTYSGGLLAQPTNIGQYRANQFGVLPEFGTSAKVRLTQRIDFAVGYSLLFLNDVARTGAQIDRAVNPSQIGDEPLVGAARPRFEFANSDFWAQSLNLGVEYRW